MLTGSNVLDWLIAAGLFLGLVAALEICFRLGLGRRQSEHREQVAAIQGAMLGLLALLLGFSFAMTAGRFSERSKLIVEEANAIRAFWLRCDLLKEDQKKEFHQALLNYTALRVAFYDAEDEKAQQRSAAEAELLQHRMWKAISSLVKENPSMTIVMVTPFNELVQQHSRRIAAAHRHLPAIVMVLLLTSSLVAVSAVGYVCGVSGKRNRVLTTSLVFLISGTLWAIIDMDHPLKGLIQAGQQPMLDLQHQMSRH